MLFFLVAAHYPEKKIGIVCVPVNEKGVLRVPLPDKKIWINHKRVKLHVAAAELYPKDYDFSIIFETVEKRKKRYAKKVHRCCDRNNECGGTNYGQ